MLHAAPVAISVPVPVGLLVRPVRAGFPSPADDHAEPGIDVQRLLIANPSSTFIVRVQGDSCVDAGLLDGDLAVVDKSVPWRVGDLVVVDVDGERSFKIWGLGDDGSPSLSFANRTYPRFELDSEADVQVWGVVTWSLTHWRRA